MNLRTALGPLLACSFATASGFYAQNLQQELNPSQRASGLEVHETHASASLLGQFRTSASSWLWLRTDLYLHNGVELRPLTDSERQAGEKGVGSAEADLGQAMGDDDVVTSIPSPDRDFRGWFGDLERATAPYRGMKNHTHNDPEQALPLFRLMTWLDPSFIDGWTTGATVIARERNKEGTRKSLQFLHEGLQANPGNVSILNNIAFIHITRRKDLRTAVRYLEQARMSAKERFSLLGEEDRDDLDNVYRWLALCYRDLGDLNQMHDVLSEGQNKFPQDAVLTTLGNTPPMILTSKGKRKWEAEQAKNAAQAATEQRSKGELDRD